MTNKETAKAIILKLVEKFAAQLELYKAGKYNETQTRIDFINPMFEALGWDIDNRTDKLETERDVFHEDKVLTDEGLKSPDYAFTINGTRQFYLEAKKPSVNIKDDISPAFQLRRYGWTTKLVISILTDFEELAIYDCFEKPVATNAAAHSRIKYIKFTNYEKEFDYIWDLLSREAVVNGSILRYAEKSEYRGAEDVDTAFLNSLDEWRDYLAKAIITGNKNITEDDLNFAVQQTLDRIIFLRICEDRGIETYKTMLNFVEKGKGDIYPQLFAYFVQADQKYNSGLFDFKKDAISRNLQIDNKVLRNIIQELYPPQSPYAFAVIPVEILGNAYEQFLGKTIKITSGNRVEIEQKPEVRKAGGVYYTPQYIVSYIVKQTVGKKIEEIENHQKTLQGLEDLARFDIIAEIAKLKICDPACGSGSFLLGAYQYLLDWHLNYYTKNSHLTPKSPTQPSPSGGLKNSPPLRGGAGGGANPLTSEGKLTAAVKKQILLNNIFGVDIDVNAVEVTKLSLLLKAIEGETAASIHTTNVMFNERALPTLDNNIQSGNSLIDMDFYENQIDFTPQEEKKIKPFNWQLKFPQVFATSQKGRAGVGLGFDVVIGNPPYVKEYTSKQTFEYIKNSHIGKKYYQGKMDLWYFFACQALELLKNNGEFGFIVPNNWVTNSGASILRNTIVKKGKIIEMIDFGSFMVFSNASIQTMLFVVQKNITETSYVFENIKAISKNIELKAVQTILQKQQSPDFQILTPTLEREKYVDKFLIFENDEKEALLANIKKKANFYLDEKLEVAQGIVPNPDVVTQKGLVKIPSDKIQKHNIKAGDNVFVVDSSFAKKVTEFEKEFLKPLYEPYHLSKYFVPKTTDKLMIYLTKKNFKPDLPNIINHLDKYKEIMLDRRENQTGQIEFYHLHWGRNEAFFAEGEKILAVRKCPNSPVFSYTQEAAYVMMSINVIKTSRINQKYLTGLLNSKLIAFWLRYRGKMQGNNYQIDKEPILQIPIYSPDFSNKTEKALHDKIVFYVEQILADYEKINSLSFESKKQPLQDKISYAEMQIDKLVCELYGLSEEEMAVVLG